jgi:hypothetical protein
MKKVILYLIFTHTARFSIGQQLTDLSGIYLGQDISGQVISGEN